MNKNYIRILISFTILFTLYNNLFSFPLTNQNLRIYQDVISSGGIAKGSSDKKIVLVSAFAQPALITHSVSSTGTIILAHGYFGGGMNYGLTVNYLKSTISNPSQRFLDTLKRIDGTATSPILMDKVEIIIKRLRDNKYFNGSGWVDKETWLKCNGTKLWYYNITRDIFDYGETYTIISRITDCTGAEERIGDGVTFTFIYSEDFKKSVACYPNPFKLSGSGNGKDTMTIEYYLPSDQKVNIAIYSINGELVKSFGKGVFKRKGLYRIQWDGKNDNGELVSNGVYMFIIQTESEEAIDKIVIIK